MEQTPQAKGSKKSGIAILVILVAVIAILWIANSWNGPKGTQESAQMAGAGQPTYTNEVSAAYREKAVSEPVKLPGEAAQNPDLKSLKAYEVRMEGGKYSPSELVVAKGGRVQISMIAVDADYDVMFAAPLGVYLNVKKGQEAVFGFDATNDKVGEYAFTCKDACPGGAMQGKLVVK